MTLLSNLAAAIRQLVSRLGKLDLDDSGTLSQNMEWKRIMKYMLLVYYNEPAMTDAERERCYVESAQLTQDLHNEGKYVDASPLQLIETATSVRVRQGKKFVTDGPFAETHEQLGGYYVIDVKDLDEAIDVAARIPVATLGTIEIRPLLEIPGLPDART
jgi:hypothetical protein